MSTDTLDTDSIGPQLALDDVSLTPAMSERFATFFGIEDGPESAANWIDMTGEMITDIEDRDPGVDDLCTTDDGKHAFVGDDHYQEYVCVLDPIAYAFITDTPGTIRSETPRRGTEVEIEITPEAALPSHEDAVVSLGISDHVDHFDDVTPEAIYRQVCGYIHVFADESEYEAWDAAVEAATTPVSVETGVAGAREIAEVLFDSRP
jgi:hypothetical protein